MDLLRSWIISLCTTLIFMTAVELLLPDNSTKKYVKFVLGLILIAVIINPFIRLFTKNTFDINSALNKYENIASANTSNSMTDENVTEERFFSNLEKNCEEVIKEKLSGTEAEVKVNGKLDMKETKLDINEVNVYVNSFKQNGIGKISVKASTSNQNQLNSELSNEIKEILSKELNLDEKKIYVYKGE